MIEHDIGFYSHSKDRCITKHSSQVNGNHENMKDPFSILPIEICLEIAVHVDFEYLPAVCRVCKIFFFFSYFLAKLWKRIFYDQKVIQVVLVFFLIFLVLVDVFL
jgi:hypothetical protein